MEHFHVKNVKCGGCASNIRDGLGKLAGVAEVAVQVDSGEVTVEGEQLDRARLAAELEKLGYPEA